MEREKEWKRLRHKLLSLPPGQSLTRTLQQQQQQQQQHLLQEQRQQQGQGREPHLGQAARQQQGQGLGQGQQEQAGAATALDEATVQGIERSRMKVCFWHGTSARVCGAVRRYLLCNFSLENLDVTKCWNT